MYLSCEQKTNYEFLPSTSYSVLRIYASANIFKTELIDGQNFIIDDVLDVRRSEILLTIDLASGYWQIEMVLYSKEKTAFIVRNHVYEWNHLAFGLTNAPGTFQHLMNFVFRSILGKTCLVYQDDIIVFSKTKGKHFNNLCQIFKLLDEANLKMKLSKCEFLFRSVHYLGHIISGDGVAPDPAKIKL